MLGIPVVGNWANGVGQTLDRIGVFNKGAWALDINGEFLRRKRLQ